MVAVTVALSGDDGVLPSAENRTAHAELRLSCIFDCGHYFFIGGYTSAALETARLLDSIAADVGDKEWVRKAKSLMGAVNADIGNIADAIEFYGTALDLAQEIHDLDGEIIVLSNLGTALMYAGLYRDAIPCFQRSALLARSIRRRASITTCLYQIQTV